MILKEFQKMSTNQISSKRPCSKCKIEKQESEYYQRKVGPRNSQCKSCMKDNSIRYEKMRYNMDPEFRERKLERIAECKQRRKQKYIAFCQAVLEELA